jgi:L-ascorbate oxidase
MLFSCRQSLLLLSILVWAWGVAGTKECHDENFVPDAVLRITAQNVTQSCMAEKLIVLINGTSPGPELRLLEGKTYWIRVYNDMPKANLTMVRSDVLNQSRR